MSDANPPPSDDYKFSLGHDNDACINQTSPICFNTAVSGQNIITGLWFNTIIGLVLLLLFIWLRGVFRFYQARLLSPHVERKPPPMKLKGHHRLWSWLKPVFSVPDEELLRSSGLDALVATRIIGFGVTLLAPMAVLGVTVLLPINYVDDYYETSARADDLTDRFTSVFSRLTMSNIRPGSPLMWIHFTMVYVFVGWTCWLTVEYYKEYIVIRQAYLVNATEGVDVSLVASDVAASLDEGEDLGDKEGGHAELEDGTTPGREGPVLRKRSRVQIPGNTPVEPNPRQIRRPSWPVRMTSPALGEMELVVTDHRHRPSGLISPRQIGTVLRKETGKLVRRAMRSNRPGWGPTGDEGAILLADGTPAPSAEASGQTTASDGSRDVELTIKSGDAARPSAMPLPEASDSEDRLPLRLRYGTGAAEEAPADSPFTMHTLASEDVAAASAHFSRPADAEPMGPIDSFALDSQYGLPEDWRARPGSPALFDPVCLRPDPGPAAASPPASPTWAGRSLVDEAPGGPAYAGRGRRSPTKAPGPRHVRAPSQAAAVAAALEAHALHAEDAVRVIKHVRARSGSCSDGTPGMERVFASFEAMAGEAPPAGAPASLAPASAPASLTPAGSDCGEEAPLSPAPALEDEAGTPLRGAAGWWLPAHAAGAPGASFSSALSSGDERRILEASASLFTVLVTDAPTEKLRLSRLGVFSLQLSVRPAGAPGDPAMAAFVAAQRDLAETIQDVEAGIVQEATAARRPSASRARARVLGWCGWLAAVLRRDTSYREWRRNVQWAMFNKRVRVATELFTELFGDDFDAIIPIYPTKPLDSLIHKWDDACASLERVEFRLGEDDVSDRRREKLSKRAAKLRDKVADLEARVTRRREEVLSDLPSTCFFATFRSQEAAAIAAQANLNPIMQRLFNVAPAPRADDINWPTLQRSWWQRQVRPLFALPGIILVMILPIGAFTGAFAQLTLAICGNGSKRSDNWICETEGFPNLLRNLITSLGPSILLSIYNMMVLPLIIYYLAQARVQGQDSSLSALDRRCADLFFFWDIFNVFLGAMLGGTILGELQTFATEPSKTWKALGSAIPAASNFFINYVSYRALVMAAFRLLYPSQAFVTSVARGLRLLPASRTERDRALELPQRNCRYGRDIGIPIMMNFVMVFGYAVVSPLILPLGLLYFITLWPVWRYQMLYVYQRRYESGGQFWPYVAHKMVWCQMLLVVFTALVLVVKAAYTQAVVMAITLPMFLLMFKAFLSSRYDAVVSQIPLMAVHAAAKGSVDPDLYTAPPLRPGAHGWHPEWGKCWQWWGIPRYTL